MCMAFEEVRLKGGGTINVCKECRHDRARVSQRAPVEERCKVCFYVGCPDDQCARVTRIFPPEHSTDSPPLPPPRLTR